MDKKFYTFLIFPGAHGKLHKVRLPFYFVHMVLAFSFVGIMTIAALVNSYARMLLKVSNYNNLRTEREALKTQNRSLENVVTTTNAKLDSLQSLATEVALTYGFGEARSPRFPEGSSGARDPDEFHRRVELPSFALRIQFDQEFFPCSFQALHCARDLPRHGFGA